MVTHYNSHEILDRLEFFISRHLLFIDHQRNGLFAGSRKGAEASAGIYTLVETAKVNGFAPMKYIKYILVDMPGSAFIEHPEYLDDNLLWNSLVKNFVNNC